LMHAIIGLAQEDMVFTVYNGLGDLPHFNPDLDVDDGSESVLELRTRLNEADAVLICTPEYGNGVPGVLKNALDWLVSSGQFMNKPTAVVTASPTPMGGDKAHDSILLTLNMINAKIVEGATMMIPHINLKLNNEGVIMDVLTERGLISLLERLEEACS
ncbi:NADPH-dependent FMN reductase, partial [Paenibacillus sp. TAF58]